MNYGTQTMLHRELEFMQPTQTMLGMNYDNDEADDIKQLSPSAKIMGIFY